MNIQIEITKDVIDRSLLCGTKGEDCFGASCALAVAYNDLIPNVNVGYSVFFNDREGNELETIKSTKQQVCFFLMFDDMMAKPEERYSFVGQKFTVEIPDKVIEYWYQDAAIAAQKIADSTCLSLVE